MCCPVYSPEGHSSISFCRPRSFSVSFGIRFMLIFLFLSTLVQLHYCQMRLPSDNTLSTCLYTSMNRDRRTAWTRMRMTDCVAWRDQKECGEARTQYDPLHVAITDMGRPSSSPWTQLSPFPSISCFRLILI
ncbi:hypothetical protein OE88DRAFT_96319 [Heliocybe sulcata]|uniref:Uncharacterized protein n=1 Tax=Heliocybe sulcata TaxID=5364 RepID=A0A5C3NIA6_9AGAM|nr:hypothetical protein OE88DRAFT_96319 [Heliocybe sulcata]